jgi:hypothetical protein
MKFSILVAVATFAALSSPPLFAQDVSDVTLSVLDAPADVAVVLDAVDRELNLRRRTDSETRDAVESRQTATPQTASESDFQTRGADDVIDSIDREEETEGELEDFDVPDDVDVPETSE